MAGTNRKGKGMRRSSARSRLVVAGIGMLILLAAAPAASGSQRAAPRMVVRPPSHERAIPPAAVASKLCNTASDEWSFAISSQNFETEFDPYDSMGAQSCTLISERAKITGVYVVGTYFDGGGPARSETVIFWADAGGLPGIILTKQTVTADDPGTGEFDIPIRPLKVRKAITPTFWFTVQINMDFNTNAQWSWFAGDTPHGLPDVWENPGNGFELCVTWCTLDTIYAGTTSFLAALETPRGRGN